MGQAPLLRNLVLVAGLGATLLGQNSTRKVRSEPSELAAKCGAAVAWRTDVEAALAEAARDGKLVFCYVPTVAGSPMDRQVEIDRYILAGPFSWPSTIDLLQRHFVPVRLDGPSKELRQRLGLERSAFIEPGWIVLGADGKEKQRLDQITTFHPQWFEAPLRRLADRPLDAFPCDDALRGAFSAYATGDHDACLREIDALLATPPNEDLAAAALFLRGAVRRRSGRDGDAKATWREVGERFPATTWASKAAMEAEGHGPFTHGFEDFVAVPDRTLRDLADGSRAPRGTYAQDDLWRLGAGFLLRMADQDGLLRDSIYDFGGTDSLPNVYLAVSFLAGQALLETARRADRNNGALELPVPVRAAIERELDLLLAATGSDQFALQDRDEILWAFSYRIRFLARWLRLRQGDKARVQPALAASTKQLQELQRDDGVWFHEYPNPFAIATALQALAEARDAGVDVAPQTVERGLRALVQCRTKEGAWSYGHPGARPPRATIEAAAGRMPLCELALDLWGKGDQDALQGALAAAYRHHGLLAAVRKYDDHADRHGYGGFFFWFDMLGRAEATMRCHDAVQRELWQAQQRKLVLDLPEFDGCFVDSHELGRCYGTAMALLCLATLDG